MKCPFCGPEGNFEELKFQCSKCGRKFDHYFGVSLGGKKVEFVIRIGRR
jgi:hypothetical protein